MSRTASSVIALFVGLCFVSTAHAHHPPRMDHCYSFTFTGQIERVEWRNPHVELFIQREDGASHQLIWLNPQQLGWAGIERDTIRAGDQVIVTVGTREDSLAQPMLLAAITKMSDGWEWSQTPQGC
jgi:hypothetical protein